MRVFLETERLQLRRFTEDDVENLVELDGDPDVMRFINGGRPTPRDEIENDVLPAFLGHYDRYAGFGFWAAGRRRVRAHEIRVGAEVDVTGTATSLRQIVTRIDFQAAPASCRLPLCSLDAQVEGPIRPTGGTRNARHGADQGE